MRPLRKPKNREEWFAFYAEYMKSPEWKAKRQKVGRRCGWRCEARHPGCTGKMDHVHHTKEAYRYMRKYGFGSEPIRFLVAVCQSCHSRIHGRPIGFNIPAVARPIYQRRRALVKSVWSKIRNKK